MESFFTTYRKKKFYSALIAKDSLCFDIGANKGVKSKLFLSLGANVVAFEPQSSCSGILDDLQRQNPNFTFYPYAVGGNNSEQELHLANHTEVATLSTAFIGYFTCDDIRWSDSEMVTVKSLDSIIAQFGVPDFCKIDTEGYEFEILSNLKQTIPLIEFEFTGGFIDETLQIISLLDKGDTRFNYILNEHPKFRLKDWVSAADMKTIFKTLPSERLHGNIFVKNEQ